MIALDGCLFEGAIHAFNLAIGPGMPNLCQPVLYPVFTTPHVKHMGHIACGGAILVARRIGNVEIPWR